MKEVLPQKFFNKPTLKIARKLLGKFLVRKLKNKKITAMIIEVEAYDGFDDKASHASRGKTERNKIMFEKAGRWYVYFTYGMHHMLNIVTGPKNYPAAVLIRGISIDNRQSVIKSNQSKADRDLLIAFQGLKLDGPAKLTKFLKIDKKFNGKVSNKKTGLWIEDRGIKIKKTQILRNKRIGVDYAGEWASKPYRFIIKDIVKY